MKRTSRSVSSKYDSQSGMKVSALEDRGVPGEEGAERQGPRGDGLDIALDQRPGYAARASPRDDGVGVGAFDRPPVLHRLAAYCRRQTAWRCGR